MGSPGPLASGCRRRPNVQLADLGGLRDFQNLDMEHPMSQKFQVTGMSCSHCVDNVQDAVKTIDPSAQVTVDLETGHVDVLSEHPRQDIVAAIENAGYKAQ
ncbi:Copper chaperone CopZ (modular protein) [Burkholderiales bacterium 8X]|nr:Copper chaperone CopZ (modular protein) [Burkholderiales bacterium 8X]